MHTALIIAAGALLAGLVGAVVFGTGEDERTREVRALLTALDAQRRARDSRLRRETARRGAARSRDDDRRTADARAPDAIPEAAAADPGEEERERLREERERAAALAAEQRRERAERDARHKAEKAARKAEEQERRQEERERAATLAARRRDEPEPQVPSPPPAAGVGGEARSDPAELPLYAWAEQIENADRAPTEPG